jgi:hypothetical protein
MDGEMKPNARTNGDQKQKNQKERNKEMKLVGGLLEVN